MAKIKNSKRLMSDRSTFSLSINYLRAVNFEGLKREKLVLGPGPRGEGSIGRRKKKRFVALRELETHVI